MIIIHLCNAQKTSNFENLQKKLKKLKNLRQSIALELMKHVGLPCPHVQFSKT